MVYVHGHAACVQHGCPMFGANQAECCDGETAGQSVAATSEVAAVRNPPSFEPPPAPARMSIRECIACTAPLHTLLEEARARLDDDPAHDLAHALRVADFTMRLGEGMLEARHAVAAALFHDIVNVPKNHPERHLASEKSATLAAELLAKHGYIEDEISMICAAIIDHSYSRGATPRSLLGRALQDADRLEALGVLGLFRTISTGSRMGARYFDADDPWAGERALDDRAYSIDHFTTKLLRLAPTLCTEEGRIEAKRRAARMERMLEELGDELGTPYVRHESLR
jgi:uncharacterized protein